MKSIKNFIYLDKDRLNSFYSQLFEGTIERFVNTYSALSQEDRIVESKKEKESITQAIGEESLKTESKVLLDYMYTELENKLDKNIFEVESINRLNIFELDNKSLVKIKGNVNINDYSRMSLFFDKFNEIGKIVAYSSISESDKYSSKIEEIKSNKTINENERIKRIDNVTKEYAKEKGLTQDEILLKNLSQMTEIFNNDGLEVLINKNNLVYRVILDEKYLRVSKELLRKLYTYKSSNEWTVVGKITFIPNENNQVNVNSDNSEDYRSAYKNMFEASNEIEKTFFISKNEIEICVVPIAIYTEDLLEI